MRSSILAAALLLSPLAALAQSATNAPATVSATGSSSVTSTPPTSSTFFTDAAGYFSTFNTNNVGCFTNRLSVWTGVDSIQGGGAPLANEFGVGYEVLGNLSFESVTRSSGVAGTLVSQQGGVGYGFKIQDVRLTPFVGGGYSIYWPKGSSGSRIFGEVGARVAKALSIHTFAWVGIGAQLPANRQVFCSGVGFTF
jgi:hypothetical protein